RCCWSKWHMPTVLKISTSTTSSAMPANSWQRTAFTARQRSASAMPAPRRCLISLSAYCCSLRTHRKAARRPIFTSCDRRSNRAACCSRFASHRCTWNPKQNPAVEPGLRKTLVRRKVKDQSYEKDIDTHLHHLHLLFTRCRARREQCSPDR